MRVEGKALAASERVSGASLDTRHSSLAACLVMIAVIGLVTTAWSQVMNDPTRPPVGLAAGESETAGETGDLVLQSVMISPTGRAAIINGAVVKLGQKYGDAVLIKVAENEVVLKSGDTTQVLKMYPGVEKRDVPPSAAKTVPRRSKGRGGDAPAAPGAR